LFGNEKHAIAGFGMANLPANHSRSISMAFDCRLGCSRTQLATYCLQPNLQAAIAESPVAGKISSYKFLYKLCLFLYSRYLFHGNPQKPSLVLMNKIDGTASAILNSSNSSRSYTIDRMLNPLAESVDRAWLKIIPNILISI
jgi:hypothetical protein